ncbi:MAG: hypothetical protein Q8S00_32325 [Deltaproteobacteria bacterium]|nr:hypothetical protein [Deltaproteobacteria bacterium]
MGLKPRKPLLNHEDICAAVQGHLKRIKAKGITVTQKPKTFLVYGEGDGFAFPYDYGVTLQRELGKVPDGGGNLPVWDAVAEIMIRCLDARDKARESCS